MRGSPLFRTILLTVGLLLAGIGMLRFQVPAEAVNEPVRVEPDQVGKEKASDWGFSLTLSAAAERVELSNREGRRLFEGAVASSASGMIEMDAADPVVFLKVEWREGAVEGVRFAKLTLEPPGKTTLVHFFEASGPIDDVWELPIK